MAAQTVSAWTESHVNGKYKATCTAYTDATNLSVYTKKTPDQLDMTRPYTLIVSADAAQDGGTPALWLYLGYDSDFAIAGTSGIPTVTSGCQYIELIDDLGYAAAVDGAVFNINPTQEVANVVTLAAVATGYKVGVPYAPYHAFCERAHADTGTLLAHTLTFTIIQ
jgi:hypothetical protein